jgi:hypothetical protein
MFTNITSITSKIFAVTKPSRVTSISNVISTKYDKWQQGPGEIVRQKSIIRDRNKASDVRRPHAGKIQGAFINENPKLKAQYFYIMQITIVTISFEKSTVRIKKKNIKRKKYRKAIFFNKLFVDLITHLLIVQPN